SNVGARRRERYGDEGARHACTAGHAHLVAGRKADRARRGGTVHATLPRRHEPGVDDRGPTDEWDGWIRRQMVRARAAALHRLARRLRPRVVARRDEDGGDL